jgi:cysteinyl-tRNA synthetase
MPQLPRLRVAIVLIGLIIHAGQVATGAHAAGGNRLGQVKTWDFQLQRYDLARLAASPADMLVIDHSRNGRAGGIFTATEIERLKRRPDGRPRTVIAYLSIGEAEDYRYYWRPEWKVVPPDWLHSENCRWPSNYLVRYWMEGWQDIIYRDASS